METTISHRGQTVVPAAIRKAHRLIPSSRLEWIDDGLSIRVVPLGKDPIGQAKSAFGKSRLTRALLKSRAQEKRHG
ncbi:MAG: AbrB/MazE/SpoVT family DNA-binding domain-containing protein [Verrucomicrobia bacterium]|nr:AbrB/MazE/SpoVT family DNA-binding domain-containing protein [Verrucomicrobiota bacterium]